MSYFYPNWSINFIILNVHIEQYFYYLTNIIRIYGLTEEHHIKKLCTNLLQAAYP